MCPPNAFNFNANGVAFTGDDASRLLGSTSALAALRTELASLNAVAAGLGAADLAFRCEAILGAMTGGGPHAAAMSLVAQGMNQARAGNAAGARTSIGSAVTVAATTPAQGTNPGVYL
jgi:hypothetical protein